MKKQRKSPSRIKYEQNNPTVSARVPGKTRDKLNTALETAGMSLSDALKVLAGELEIKVKPLQEARKAGYEEAQKLYRVTYPCYKCGGQLVITDPEAKAAAGILMTRHGWGHTECPK